MIEIFIEGKRLDVTADVSHLLTFALDDIKDFSSRNTTFSKTITLPGTANNNYLFGSIYDVKISNPYSSTADNVATNFNAAVSADCLIFQSRLQVFKGTLRVLEVIIDNGMIEYEVSVVGELGGLVSAIGSDKLEDLDFSAYDHIWNVGNVTGSWENVSGGSFYYPLIDYGTVSVDKVNYDIRAFRPALFVKEYIDKIMTGAGYSYTCDLFNTARFKSLVIPNNQKALQSKANEVFEVGCDTGYYLINNSGGNDTPQMAVFDYQPLLGSFTASNLNTRFTYTGTDSFVGNINLSMLFDFSHTDDQGDAIFYLYKNGAQVIEIARFQDSESLTVNLADYNIQLNQNDYLEIKCEITQTTLQTYYVYVYSATWGITSAADVWTNINYGNLITINDTIPRNISQKDFLGSIIRLFNLYLYEDQFASKKILIKPYIDFYNTTGVTDWTYKVDRSRPMRVKPMSELNSRFYNFTYKEDSDYYNELYKKTYNEVYGSMLYDSAFEFVEEKKDIQLIFSPTPLVGYAGTDKIVSAMLKKNNGVEEQMQTNIRIMQAKKVTGVTPWNIMDGLSPLVSGLTTYGYAGHYDDPDAPANDINFGVPNELYFTLTSGAINVTQFNVYWSPYMAEITDKDSKLLTCYVKLTAADIFNLNFSTFIYIDGSYWRLNKIEDWNAAEPDVCKCEFLKVINLFY